MVSGPDRAGIKAGIKFCLRIFSLVRALSDTTRKHFRVMIKINRCGRIRRRKIDHRRALVSAMGKPLCRAGKGRIRKNRRKDLQGMKQMVLEIIASVCAVCTLAGCLVPAAAVSGKSHIRKNGKRSLQSVFGPASCGNRSDIIRYK